MSYATVANVKGLFRDFADNTDAAVDDTEIQDFLDDTDEIIDAKIGTLYQLPIDALNNPKSFKILKRLETFIVSAIIDDILNNYGEADKKPSWAKNGRDLMLELVPARDKKTGKQPEPIMKLSDAIYLGTSTQRNKMSASATTGRIFIKGGDNW